jgi:hypothetical protein
MREVERTVMQTAAAGHGAANRDVTAHIGRESGTSGDAIRKLSKWSLSDNFLTA